MIIDKDLCNNCRHYLGGLKCMAFLDGIPESILNGENDHTVPLPKQGNDITFESDNNGTLGPQILEA